MSEPVYDRFGNKVGETSGGTILEGRGTIADANGNSIGSLYPSNENSAQPLYDRNGLPIGELVVAGGLSSVESLGCLLILIGILGGFISLISIPLVIFSFIRNPKGLNPPSPKGVGCWFWGMLLIAPMSTSAFLLYDEFKRRGFLSAIERKVCQVVIIGSWILMTCSLIISAIPQQ